MPRFKLRIAGPAGRIETVIDDPGASRKGLAFIAHPHPLHGGSFENKVVKTIATALLDLGYVAVRPNFRGVGASSGEYDGGRGEVEDMLAVHDFVRPRYPELPVILAGFSFGAYVQSVVAERVSPQHVLLVGPAVNLFQMGRAAPGTIVIHGEQDELVPAEAARQWAQSHGATFALVPGADHFFHRKLSALREHIEALCPC